MKLTEIICKYVSTKCSTPSITFLMALCDTLQFSLTLTKNSAAVRFKIS